MCDSARGTCARGLAIFVGSDHSMVHGRIGVRAFGGDYRRKVSHFRQCGRNEYERCSRGRVKMALTRASALRERLSASARVIVAPLRSGGPAPHKPALAPSAGA